jgi:colanic acid/amylovoran biosynthesis glycosyltransferase
MRIAFIVNNFPTLSETFILNQITGMMDLGHNVEIFAKLNPGELKYHGDIDKYQILQKVNYFEKIPQGRVKTIIKTFNLLVKYIQKDPILLFKSFIIFKKHRYGDLIGRYYFSLPFLGKQFDIVQCHFCPNGNIGAYLKQSGFNIKVVTMFHGYDIRFIGKKGKDIYNPVIKYGDCFLSISSYNYRNIVDIGIDAEKILHHPVGIDIKKYFMRSEFVSLNEKKKIIFITVARLVEEKGLPYAIEAISEIIDRYPELNIEYRIVGDGPLKKSLNDTVERLQLKNHIKFLGEMVQDDVIRNLMDSDIFLLSSLAEALPVVLMEAQAIGLPVVTTGVGSISEIVIDTVSGFIVPARDIEAMKNKIAYLIDHYEIWQEMGRAGRENVAAKYDINILNKKLDTIYKGLIGSSK